MLSLLICSPTVWSLFTAVIEWLKLWWSDIKLSYIHVYIKRTLGIVVVTKAYALIIGFMYVCKYYIYAYTYIYTYMCVCMCIYIYANIRMYIHAYTCAYVHLGCALHMFSLKFIYSSLHTIAVFICNLIINLMYVNIDIFTHTFIHVCL